MNATMSDQAAAVTVSAEPELSQRRSFARRFVTHKPALLSVIFLLVLCIIALFAPQLAPKDPTAIEMFRNVGDQVQNPPFPPGPQNWFGTDQLGRDIFSRVLFAIRTSLLIGVLVRGGAMIVGVVLGLLAGYLPGAIGPIIMRTTDMMLALPALLVAMAVTAALGPSLFTVGLALVLVGWPDVARLVYGQTLAVRETEYVLAAHSLGASARRILTRHILPNILSPILVAFSMGIPGAIMYEAGLSFFGFGLQPPTPSLGSIINDGRGYMNIAPWYTVFPGLTLVAIVLAFNFLGEGLIDILDPEQTRES